MEWSKERGPKLELPREKLEPSASLGEMLGKLMGIFGERVSIVGTDTHESNIYLDKDFRYNLAYYEKDLGFVLTDAGEYLLGIAKKKGADIAKTAIVDKCIRRNVII